MFKKNNNKIDIGDRFVKKDEPTIVWVVTGVGSPIAAIPHFQVVREGYTSRLRTLSEQVLLDTDFYSRVEWKSKRVACSGTPPDDKNFANVN